MKRNKKNKDPFGLQQLTSRYNSHPMLYPLKDKDHDRVKNVFDCQPLNRKKHGIIPNKTILNEMKGVNILVTERSRYDASADINIPIKPKKLLGKDTHRIYPMARIQTFAMLKKNPGIITELKKHKVSKITFITEKSVKNNTSGATIVPRAGEKLKREIYVYPPPEFNLPREDYKIQSTAYIDVMFPPEKRAARYKDAEIHRKRSIFPEDSPTEKIHQTRKSFALTSWHELTHARQAVETSPEEFDKRMDKEKEMEYFDRPMEVEARSRSENKFDERYYDKTSEEEKNAAYRKLMEEVDKL